MRNFLIVSIALLIGLVFLAIGSFYILVDADRYKSELLRIANAVTGRDVSIGGPLAVRPGWHVEIEAHKVEIANAAWGRPVPLLAADTLTFRVPLVPLLQGNFDIETVRARNVSISLEVNEKGQKNWDVAEAFATPADTGSLIVPNAIDVVFQDTNIAYFAADSDKPDKFTLQRLSLSASSRDTPLFFNAAGQLPVGKTPFDLQGSLPSIDAFRNGDVIIPVTLRVETASADMSVKGSIDRQAAPFRATAKVDAKIGDLDRFAAAFALPTHGLGPGRLTAEITLQNRLLEFAAVHVQAADIAGDGAASLNFGDTRPKLNGKLALSEIDLNRWLPEAPAIPPAIPDDPPHRRLFSDAPLKLPAPLPIDVQLEFSIGKLHVRAFTLNELRGHLQTDAKAMGLRDLAWQMAEGRFSGDMALAFAGKQGLPVWNVALNSSALNMGAVMTRLQQPDTLQGTGHFQIDVTGEGRSIAETLSRLNGTARFLMTDGSAKTNALDTFVGGTTAIIGRIFAQEGAWTEIRCAVGDFTVDAGVVTPNIFLFNTKHVVVVGTGDLRLSDEQVNLKFTPSPKSLTLNVSLPVHLEGSLQNPAMRLDEAATARRLGGLLTGLIFPPAALLGLADLGGGDHPCVQNIAAVAAAGKNAPKENPGGESASVTDTVGKTLKAVGTETGKALQSIGKGIKSLLGD